MAVSSKLKRNVSPLIMPSPSQRRESVPLIRPRSGHIEMTTNTILTSMSPHSLSASLPLASANPFKRYFPGDSIWTPKSASRLSRASRSQSRSQSRSRSRSRSRSNSRTRSRSRRASLTGSIKTYCYATTHTTTTKFMALFPDRLRPWVPLLIWGGVSLFTLVIFLIFRKSIVRTLELFSLTLRGMGFRGILIMWSLIFLTTFPPISGYSTLVGLSGFTFGFMKGFIISYTAALIGGMVVFSLSRAFLQTRMILLLSKSKSLQSVVKAIEKKGFNLLFLIRIAPYPYNVLNVLLASSPLLKFSTYTLATACALPKLMFHAYLGSTLSSFSENTDEKNSGISVVHVISFVLAGITGVAVLIYLFIVARKAVEEIQQEVNSDVDSDIDTNMEREEEDAALMEHSSGNWWNEENHGIES